MSSEFLQLFSGQRDIQRHIYFIVRVWSKLSVNSKQYQTINILSAAAVKTAFYGQAAGLTMTYQAPFSLILIS